MSKNARYAIEAILVAAAILIIAMIVMVAQGYWMTKNYVPDIIESYASVDNLQHEVSFGTISTIQPSWLIPTVAFVVLATVYYICRKWLSGKQARHRDVQ